MREKNNCLILVLDFGSDHIKKLEKIFKASGVKAIAVKPTVSTSELKKACGIVLSGSNSSVYEKNRPKYNSGIFSVKKPILGVCYGQQLMAYFFGGKVEKMKKTVNAKRKLRITKPSPLFDGLLPEEIVWMEHGDNVTMLPAGFRSIAKTRETKNAAIEDKNSMLFGIQFHPELSETKKGKKIVENFVQLCKERFIP